MVPRKMAKFEKANDCDYLLNILQRRLPASGYMYNIVKLKDKLGSIDIFTLCLSDDENDTWIISMHYDRKDYGTEFAVSPPIQPNKDHFDTIKEALKDKTIFNWVDPYMFPSIPRSVSTVFIENAVEHGTAVTLRPCLFFCSDDPTPVIDVPEGVELRRLTLDDAGVVMRNWKYTKDSTPQYVHKLIRELPSVGVFYKGELVSGILISAYGIAAFLFTEDKHRRKGYAKLAMLELFSQMKQSGIIPVSAVETENVGSVKVHYQCDMKFVDYVDLIIR